MGFSLLVHHGWATVDFRDGCRGSLCFPNRRGAAQGGSRPGLAQPSRVGGQLGGGGDRLPLGRAGVVEGFGFSGGQISLGRFLAVASDLGPPVGQGSTWGRCGVGFDKADQRPWPHGRALKMFVAHVVRVSPQLVVLGLAAASQFVRPHFRFEARQGEDHWRSSTSSFTSCLPLVASAA